MAVGQFQGQSQPQPQSCREFWSMHTSVMAYFVCALGWAKGAQIAGKTRFLGESARVSPEEITV